MKKLMLLVWLMLLPALASPLPKASGGGDYWIRDEDTWLDWVVTAPELVGRLASNWPTDEASPDALIAIDWIVYKWPVVARFYKGQRLKAVADECGGILIKDIDGGTWMKVELAPGSFCFVRANAKYIKPAQPIEPASQIRRSKPQEPAQAEPATIEVEPVQPEEVPAADSF